jgi:regulator of extracellular matrix RemA (YlzA/DUF370 family)
MSKLIQNTKSKVVNIGFENHVVSGRIVAIICPGSAPVKRMIIEARKENRLVDGCGGRPKRSVIITDSGHVVLSSIAPRNLSARIEKNILD